MTKLKLYGMRASFDKIAGKGLNRRDEVYPLIASLIRAERTHRQPAPSDTVWAGPSSRSSRFWTRSSSPTRRSMRVRCELANGAFLDARRYAIFLGETGTEKTHLAMGVVAAVIRARARGRLFSLVDLVNQLEQEKAAG